MGCETLTDTFNPLVVAACVRGEEPHFAVGQTLALIPPGWVPLSLQQTLIKHLLHTVLSSGDAAVCEVDTVYAFSSSAFHSPGRRLGLVGLTWGLSCN